MSTLVDDKLTVYLSDARRYNQVNSNCVGVQSMRTISFLSGALCGAVVGAVAILLLTPTSGSEMRKSMIVKVGDIVDEAKKTILRDE